LPKEQILPVGREALAAVRAMCELLKERELAERAGKQSGTPAGASFYGGVDGALNLRQDWSGDITARGGKSMLALLLLLLPVGAFAYFRRKQYDAVDDEDTVSGAGSRRRHDGRVGLPMDADGDEDERTVASVESRSVANVNVDEGSPQFYAARSAVDHGACLERTIELSAVPAASPTAGATAGDVQVVL
jgi:hypothetical protein